MTFPLEYGDKGEPFAPEVKDQGAWSAPQSLPLLRRPISDIVDGWDLFCGCLYLFVQTAGTGMQRTLIIPRRGGCRLGEHRP